MTVEASIALPLFLFFFANILSMFLFFHTYAANLEDLHQTGRELALAGYSVGETGLTDGDMVELVTAETVKPVIPILGYSGARVVAVCNMKAWTGYDTQNAQTDSEEEEYVYITETGTVYHSSSSCSYLALTITMASAADIGSQRNASGGKYYACSLCADTTGGVVYITSDGDRYHSSLTCSSLKRTVYCVPLSQVGSRTACSRCGG